MVLRDPTVGCLFSGIGGLDLGLEWAGWRVVWQAESDPYCSAVLARHWPDVANLGDVRSVEWERVRAPDLVCGGFPCQPVSHAGARRGLDDERWLWPEFARCLRVLRPEWCLVENVAGLLTLGFAEVAADLAALGYHTEWACIPAAAFGAPHLRWRLFVVGHDPHADRAGLRAEPQRGLLGTEPPHGHDADRLRSHVADAPGARLPDRVPAGLGRTGTGGLGTTERRGAAVADADRSRRGEWPGPRRDGAGVAEPADRGHLLADPHGEARDQARPTGQAILRTPARFGAGRRGGGEWCEWEPEPAVGRVADGIPHRVDRLRALGNAVVPQVAEWLGRCILEVAE